MASGPEARGRCSPSGLPLPEACQRQTPMRRHASWRWTPDEARGVIEHGCSTAIAARGRDIQDGTFDGFRASTADPPRGPSPVSDGDPIAW
jgi:hypothetical protein